MTDRYDAFIVVLEKNTRSDDAEAIVNALRMIKGVVGVEPHVADFTSAIAESRVRADYTRRLFDSLSGE
jgi:hypothetical protein